MASPKDIAKLIAILSAAYPNFSPNEFTLEVYLQDLRDIDPEELFEACAVCRAEAGRKFAPSTGEIRGAVAELRRQISGIPTSFEAWEDLLQAGNGIKKRVTDDNVIETIEYKFLHPLVKVVAEQLGWPDRFPGNLDTAMADRAHYFKAYDSALGQYMTKEIMPESVKQYIEVKREARLLAMNDLTKKLEAK